MTIDYEALRDQGLAAMTRGDLKAARRHLEAARRIAEALRGESPGLLDQAEVNLAMVHVQAHDDGLAEKGLREVLLRSSNDDIVRLAAHCLAKVLSHRNDHEKALRYAKLSLERARALGEPLKLHGALSLLGAVRLNHSYLEESLAHYEAALAVLEANPPEDRAKYGFYWCMATDNVGYVLVLLDRAAEGRLYLESALERAQALGIADLVAEISVDLCFAQLQLGDAEQARRHGEQALAIAEAQGLDFFRRNCYYLLGEAASRLGDERAADEWYRKLGEFYPHLSFLGDFLRKFDISGMINLKEFA